MTTVIAPQIQTRQCSECGTSKTRIIKREHKDGTIYTSENWRYSKFTGLLLCHNCSSRECCPMYYDKHRDEIKTRKKEEYHKYIDKSRAYHRERYHKDIDKTNEKQRERYRRNPEVYRAKVKRYRDKQK